MTRTLRTHCSRGHPFDETNTHYYRGKTGVLRRVCRACAKLRNPFRKRLYGLDPDDYLDLVEDQAGLCAICGGASEDRALAVDHEHASGSIRGLLCSPCNSGLGMFRDDPELMRRAITYLEAHVHARDRHMPIVSTTERDHITTALEFVIDALATDVEELGAGREVERTVMWTFLPERFRDRYDVAFAIRFLLATARVGERIFSAAAYPATCVAEELALRAVMRTAIADAHELGSDDLAERLQQLADMMVPDVDVLVLFEAQANLSREAAFLHGVSHLWFDEWFRPFDRPGRRARGDLN